MTTTHPSLARRLTLGDAVTIGLGSMIGAGVFAAFAPAARAAGGGLLIGLVVAGVVAFCNATSSAQLAARYPASGGTYVYGREELGPGWGFLAGWAFVIGKTASCAAMALTFATYTVGEGWWARGLAVVAIWALALVNYHGVTRTAQLTRVIVAVVLVVLAFVVVACLAHAEPARLARLDVAAGGPYGILQSAGLLFFAFAGYARIATMGEEVRDPARTIPRAIVGALLGALAVYAVIAVSLLTVLTPAEIGSTTTPLATAVQRAWGWGGPVVRVGAAVASLGALLGLVAGVGRTSLAMAREHDLPTFLAAVHPRYQVPHRAELVLALVVSVVVLLADVRGAIGFSSTGVLVYYAIANASAFHQREGRRYPRWLQALGVAGCLTLVASLPWPSLVGGLVMLAVGVLAYRLRRRRRTSPARRG